MTEQSREWPTLKLGKWKGSDDEPLWTEDTAPVGDFGDVDVNWECETYVPASAPNVLSPLEARYAAVAIKSWAGPYEAVPQALLARLKAYAETEEK